MLKNQTIFLLLFLWILPSKGVSQEIRTFKVTDFDLNGKVDFCLVSTDYGKEEYRFDESGRLIEAVTRYNESDYDVTLYKYGNGELQEKRIESYREKLLDKATSIANFYTYDSTQNLTVTEKIITYEKEFLEQYVYSYTIDKKLSKIVRTNNEGIDETAVVYYEDEEGENANYILNRELQKSVKTKIKSVSDSIQTKTVLTKKFLEGKPNSATEEVFDSNGKLVSAIEFLYNSDLEEFVVDKSTALTYDLNGTILSTEIKTGKEVSVKEFIYQYDTQGNWIKQIVKPENSYKTRKISYYKANTAVEIED